MKDIRLDIINIEDVRDHDLLIEKHDLSLVDGIERVVQNLRIRLWFFYKEWYLNTSVGVRFYEDIKVKNPDFTVIENVIKTEILGTEDVNEILEFDITFDIVARKIVVTFKINTTFGIVPITEVLS